MKMAICIARFKRFENSPWETGLAICSKHLASQPYLIVPDDGRAGDEVHAVHAMHLDWTQSLDLRAWKWCNDMFGVNITGAKIGWPPTVSD